MAKHEQLRVPPHAIDAEQAVLGALMMDNEAYWQVESIVKPADFFRRDHQLIFEGIRNLAQQDQPHDCIHMTNWFEEQGQLELVAGGAYLIELQASIYTLSNVKGYAEIVAEKSTLRKLIDAGMHLVNRGFQPLHDDPGVIASEAVALIEEADRRVAHEGTPVRAVMKAVFDATKESCEWDEKQMTGIRFGYPELEEALDGLQKRRCYGIGARTKMGKTILLENISTNVALDGLAVGVWSIEMGELEWGTRMLSHVSGVPEIRIKRGKMLTDEDWTRYTVAVKDIRDLRHRIYDNPSASLERIAAQAMMLKARGELDLIVVDYLQIMEMSEKGERRDLDVGHNSWGLKQLAKRLDVPVVYAFAIGRGNEQGHTVRPPRPSDARESGNIEQDLDAMILLHRPGYYDKKSKGVRAEIALNRCGPTGVYRLEEDLNCCRFLPGLRPWHDDDAANHDASGFD